MCVCVCVCVCNLRSCSYRLHGNSKTLDYPKKLKELSLPDFKAYYRAGVFKTAPSWWKDRQWVSWSKCHLLVHPATRPSTHPSVRPSTLPSTRPSTRPSTHPSIRPSTRSSIHPSIRPSTRPSVLPSVHPSIRPSTRPSTHPSIRPSTRHIIYALSGVLDIQRGNRRDLIVKEFRYLQHEQY